MAKRGNGEGTIRKRSDNLWEGRYCAGRDTDGKPIQKSVYGKTQKEVIEKLSTITNDIRTGLFLPPDEITCGQWLDIWQTEYLGGVKDSTKAQYKYHIENNIKPVLGSVPLQKLSAPMIQKMYRKKMEGKKPLSAKSVKNLHGVFHKALNKAVQCRYIKYNPADACELPRVEKKEMRTISGESLKRFLQEIKGKPHEDLYYFDLFTGLREAEVIGLTWDCIDFENGIINVSRQYKRERQTTGGNVYKFDTLKNGKSRKVSPAPAVFDLLRKVKAQQAKNKLKLGSSYSNPEGFVFTKENGEHLSESAIWRNLKKRAAAIGIPGLRFHDLRHSFATLSIQNKVDVKTVSESLGHATVAFTLDVYGHVNDEMRKDAANKMQSYIESIGG